MRSLIVSASIFELIIQNRMGIPGHSEAFLCAGCLASLYVTIYRRMWYHKEKNRPLDSLAGRFYAKYFIKPANGITKKRMQKNCTPTTHPTIKHNYLISIRRVAGAFSCSTRLGSVMSSTPFTISALTASRSIFSGRVKL